HGLGCGMAAEGDGMDVLRRTIAGYALHANFGGILIIGLGCEANQIGGLMRAHNLETGAFLHTMTIQEAGGSTATVNKARAENREVGQKLVDLMRWWEDYTAKNNGSMDNNPSPGNKAGGLTTILEKALGAATKGGTTNLVDVLQYAAPLKHRGFNFMDSPG